MKVLVRELEQLHRLINASKLKRICSRPIRYLKGHAYKVISSATKKGYLAQVNTLFGSKMHLLLPSGLDIYLFAAKTHDSELRLSKFLAKTLEVQHIFFDVGAHYGYYSMLAIAAGCKEVFSFEPSGNSFQILEKNTSHLKNATAVHAAVIDSERELTFYEFPILYAENNTTQADQFDHDSWTKNNPPVEVKVIGITLDAFINSKNTKPDIIKIDVEGGELEVLLGLANYLTKYSPIISLELVFGGSGFNKYQKAYDFLVDLSFQAHSIEHDGSLRKIDDLHRFIEENHVDSENIIFKRP